MIDDTKDTARPLSAANDTITVKPGGPLILSGDPDIVDAHEHVPGLRFCDSLCCSGLSASKPFFDGNPRHSDFTGG